MHPAENESLAHAGPAVSLLAFLAHLKGTNLRCLALLSDSRFSSPVRLERSSIRVTRGNLMLLSGSAQPSGVTDAANSQRLIDSSGGRPVVMSASTVQRELGVGAYGGAGRKDRFAAPAQDSEICLLPTCVGGLTAAVQAD
jgi:hypothetical protein